MCVFDIASLPKAQEDHSLIRALPAVIGKVGSALHAMLQLHEIKITPQHKRRWINKIDLIWFLTLFAFGLVKFGEDKFIIIVDDAYAKEYKGTMK